MGVYTAIGVFQQNALCEFLLNDLNIFSFSEVCRYPSPDKTSHKPPPSAMADFSLEPNFLPAAQILRITTNLSLLETKLLPEH